MRVVLLWFCLVFGPAALLRAHDPGLSTAQIAVRDQTLLATVTFSVSDLRALQPPEPVTAEWMEGLLELRVGGVLLRATAAKASPGRGHTRPRKRVMLEGRLTSASWPAAPGGGAAPPSTVETRAATAAAGAA